MSANEVFLFVICLCQQNWIEWALDIMCYIKIVISCKFIHLKPPTMYANVMNFESSYYIFLFVDASVQDLIKNSSHASCYLV